MANVKDIFKNAIVLFLITAVVAALLAGANLLTKDKIEENKSLAEQKALAEVMQADVFEPVQDRLALLEVQTPVTSAYIAKNGEAVVGYCLKVTPSGYGGEMELVFGVDTNMTLTGLSVLSHGETAGLGANISKENFREQFVGKRDMIGVAKSGAKENEIQALSGATVSSKAVAAGANSAIAAAQYLANTPGMDAVKEAEK